MAQQTAAGSKIYIGTTAAATSQANFESDTFTEIGEVTNIGDFGKVYQDIPTNTINQRQTKHAKGAYDQGTLELQVYMDVTDSGQDAVQTALDSDDEYNIKIILNDAPAGSPSQPTTYYFRALVMSYRRSIADVNSMITASISLAINTDPVEVATVS